jgi:hypothetical protein
MALKHQHGLRMASQNQVYLRLESMLLLSLAFQKSAGNHLTILISYSFLEDLKKELFFVVTLNKSSVIVYKPPKRILTLGLFLVLTSMKTWILHGSIFTGPPQLSGLET